MSTPTQTERIARIENRAAKKAAYRTRKGKTKPPFSRTRGTFKAPFDGEVEVSVEALPRGAHRRALPRIEWRIIGEGRVDGFPEHVVRSSAWPDKDAADA